YQTIDNQTRQAACVDFSTNAMGYEWNSVADGMEVKTQNGEASSFIIENQQGLTVTTTEKQVNSIYGNIGNDNITGDESDNWLSGGAGSDTLKGEAGNDMLIIDSQDLQENINGGSGI